ncbi:hypothetical protein NRIC_26130 [Enterococcus florum]|uniref:VWFA domain-containing protein n=1 Tax=Enterococcus florum TaxID=2480627 RepID=A0A4P5PGE6_9ENTE|nr:leucine-rich repeat protein [Enterococcus florum]GCF94722.1 hypothetical protein NRIC_26130 [Enterococcus florum]
MKKKKGFCTRMTRISTLIMVVVISLYTLFSHPLQAFAKESIVGTTSSTVVNKKQKSPESAPENSKFLVESEEAAPTQSTDEEIKPSQAEKEGETSKSEKDLGPVQATSNDDSAEKPANSNRQSHSTMAAATIDWEGVASSLGNVYYRLWSDGRAGVVHGNQIAENATIEIPDTVVLNGKNYDVVHIYENAFLNNKKIKSLRFTGNSNLEYIFEGAFEGCTNLEKIYFEKCRYLREIRASAFKGCTKLNYVSFDTCERLVAIGSYAFAKCGNLAVALDFSNCKALKKIEERAFSNCKKLSSISFENCEKLEEIGPYAFTYCEGLSGTLDFSSCKTLTAIGDEAFSACKNITSLNFGSDPALKSVGTQSFRDCEGLGGTVINIPDSIKTFGEKTFMNTINGYKELHHQKIAEVKGVLPNLTVEPIALPAEAEAYESKVDSSRNKTLLHKGAKWTNKERTEAEIRIDYGYNFDRIANVDIVFVMDYSASMLSPTPITKNGVNYNYPRAYLTDDIVNDASKMFLESDQLGYDNRVAVVAFGDKEEPLYTSNFMTTSDEVKNHLIKSPSCWAQDTNYDAGMNGAIKLLENNKQQGREQAVIFLSDGEPNRGNGISQADSLRKNGVNVYPVAMYAENNGTPEALKKLSHDEKTVYVADDTDSFEKIMADVVKDVINHAEPLTVKLEDVLGKEFELPSGTQADFELSPDGGSVIVSADKRNITWDLRDCAQGVAHTLKIKVRVEEGKEFVTTGTLETNESLEAISTKNPLDPAECLETVEQPQLDRYLAHFEFKNVSFPGKELPEEVRKLLPLSKGGFANNTPVQADQVTNKVRTKDGQWWEFLGWDENEKTIAGKDILFSGGWRYVGYDFSFIKQNEENVGLPNAEFSLYVWKGNGSPKESDLVNDASLAAGKWQLIDTQTSRADGRVDFLEIPVQEGRYFQLVETKAPFLYVHPQGQWRLTFSEEDGFFENDQIIGLPGKDGQPPVFEKIPEGEHQGMWRIINKHANGEMPATGGRGSSSFAIAALICWGIGMSGLGGWHLYNRKKK